MKDVNQNNYVKRDCQAYMEETVSCRAKFLKRSKSKRQTSSHQQYHANV